MTESPLTPFGLEVTVDPGTRWEDLAPERLRHWVDTHRLLLLRGLAPMAPHALAKASRALGPLQPWPFGAVHEIKIDPQTGNYLYTDHQVPLHWDGAFADAVPHWLVFQCVAAPQAGAGGETVFVDTTRALDKASAAQRLRWETARVRYSTERKAHYGGSFTAALIATHPTFRCPVIRYAEPVRDLNPVTVDILGTDPRDADTLMADLSSALHDPEVELVLAWQAGDVIIADNHALLHGRRAFRKDAPRHLLRVNVLDPTRRWRSPLRDVWRLRRPEFMRAEIPILLIPALLSARRLEDFARASFWEGVALFWLLFHVGDLVNCLLDSDVDLHRKTHLSEAVRALGRPHVKVQIVLSAAVAIGLGTHLAVTLARPWMAPAAAAGILLGVSYTAPPLRLKSRGLWQIAAYLGLLFIGPMILVSGLFVAWPPIAVVLVSAAYGAMQTGALLINTAEDLDEDEREGIRTVAVALQARGTLRLARALSALGGLALASLLAPSLPASLLPALVPLVGVIAYNDRWLAVLTRQTRQVGEAQRREAIRKQGKYVPRHVEAGAWAALIGALAVFVARLLRSGVG